MNWSTYTEIVFYLAAWYVCYRAFAWIFKKIKERKEKQKELK